MPTPQKSFAELHVYASSGLFNCKTVSCGATGQLADFCGERPKQTRAQRARVVLKKALSYRSATITPKSSPAATEATKRHILTSRSQLPARLE
ncbi:MAG: hypothetical protein ABI210_11315 [Abditibacteriaceae bacterium]